MKHCVLILQLSHLCIFDLMISKLQFNLKFNHPSNIFFLELGSNFLSTILTENSIVKLAVRLHIIFWSKPLHRLFQIFYCICVYLVLYLCEFSSNISSLSKLHLTIGFLNMYSDMLSPNRILLLYLYLLLHVFIFSFSSKGHCQKLLSGFCPLRGGGTKSAK